MDGSRFDGLTRSLASGRSRRSFLKAIMGGGVASVATVAVKQLGNAAWSTLVCLPDGNSGFIQRLVPTMAVPFYVGRYGAIVAENGQCPEHKLCVGIDCGATCTCVAPYPGNSIWDCAGSIQCENVCESDSDCNTEAGFRCYYISQSGFGCSAGAYCAILGDLCIT